MIHAWAGENKLVLAQKKVRDEAHEITVIPEVLDELLVKGCIVPLDAIGCQKSITQKIREKEADYVLSLKQNQKKLYSQVETFFDQEFENDFREMEQFETSEKGHGHEEHRVDWLSKKIDWLEGKEDWEDLKSIGSLQDKKERGMTKLIELEEMFAMRWVRFSSPTRNKLLAG